jgi:hypothetical protein
MLNQTFGYLNKTHVLTLIQWRPLLAMTSTLTPKGRASLDREASEAIEDVLIEKVLKIETIDAGAHRTSFHTAIRYGEFVDRGGRFAQAGSSRNY